MAPRLAMAPPAGGAAAPWAAAAPALLGLLTALLATATCVLQPRWAFEHAPMLAAAAAGPVILLLLTRRAAQGGLALLLLLALVAGGSDLSLRAEGADAAGGVDAVSAAKLGLWLLGGVVLLGHGLARPALQRLQASPALATLALFFACGLATSPWSYTPSYSAAAALAGLGIVALAVVLAERLTPRQALLGWVLALAWPVAASLWRGQVDAGAAMVAMDGGNHLRLAGWFGSPNNLGRAAALLLLLAALAAVALKGVRGALLLAAAAALALPALVQSESRGALLALAAALAWWAFAPRPRLGAVALALAAALLLLLLAVPWWLDDLALAFSRSGRLEEIVSATGRTEIWQASLALIERAPWFGHGFASSRELLPTAWQDAHGWTTTSAHNLWLQAALGGGVLALALLLVGQLAWLRDALARPRPAADTVVMFVLVLGLLEASAAGPSINSMTLALAWALALGARRG